MRKKVVALLCVLLFSLGLSGCFRVELGFEIVDKNNANISLLYTFSDNITDLMGGEEALLENIDLDGFLEDGFSYEKVSEDGYSGVLITKSGVSMKELTEGRGPDQINSIFRTDGKSYIFDVDMLDELGDDVASQMGLLSSTGGYIRMKLTTPTPATNHNATGVSSDGKTLTWDLAKMSGSSPSHAEFTLSSGPSPLVYIIGGVGLLLVIVLLLSKKKRPQV